MTRATLLALTLLLPVACVAPAPGYGPGPGPVPYVDSGFGLGADYYEPFPGDYGGWGTFDHVAPYRGGGIRRGGFAGGQHAFRGPAAGRRMPSIPHAGGSRAGGGGRGGGGGHHGR